jgi:hypothetical protein
MFPLLADLVGDTEPSMPPLSAICERASQGPRTISTPIFSSPLSFAAGLLDRLAAAQQGHAAAGQNAFFDRRAGGVQGVFDAAFFCFMSASVSAPT